MISNAIFSDDRKYRYSLTRIWDSSKLRVCFIGLNPSTANEHVNDPTIRRCIKYAMDWDYGSLIMVNLFAYRTTNPKELMKQKEPIGEGNTNTHRIIEAIGTSKITICAWGTKGGFMGRDNIIMSILTGSNKLHYLKLTKDRHPCHPLYLPAALKPIPYRKEG